MDAPTVTPAQHAERGIAALVAHGAILGAPYPVSEYGLSDLLTDLAHLAALRGWRFARECECAVENCARERGAWEAA